MKMHMDVREKCPMCGVMVREVKKHLFVVHKQSHKCPECQKEFAALLGVDMHRHKVHGLPKPSKSRAYDLEEPLIME